MPLKVIDRKHTGRYTPTIDGFHAELIEETLTDGKLTFTCTTSGPLMPAVPQLSSEPWEDQMLNDILSKRK